MRDYLIVGCGLSGAVVARELADSGKNVEIWDRRDHIGGNMYDYIDAHGILVQQYGPHTFHTNNKKLYEYMCRFAQWDDYYLKCGAVIDGICTPTPFNFKTVDDFYTPEEALELKQRLKTAFAPRETATVVEVLAHPDPLVRSYAEFLFAKDYSLYTAKQWGVSPSDIDPSVLARVPLRFSYDEGYFDDLYQIMPHVSFTAFFEKLLDHPNITVRLGIDALKHLRVNNNRLELDEVPVGIPVIYTGALDELFGFSEGRLPYRSLRFEWKNEALDSFQPAPVVAYPQAEGYTRITEYKKLPFQQADSTTYAVEYPMSYDPNKTQEPYYPVLTEDSKRQYATYAALADQVDYLHCCGRLADFKYYNMDQALERALNLCAEIETQIG